MQTQIEFDSGRPATTDTGAVTQLLLSHATLFSPSSYRAEVDASPQLDQATGITL